MLSALRRWQPWLVASVCAVLSLVVLLGEQAAYGGRPLMVWLWPPLAFVAALVLWVKLWLGGCLVVLGSLAIDGARVSESAALLASTMLALFLFGRLAPVWQGLLFIAGALVGAAVAGGFTAADLVPSLAYGLFLYLAIWGLGRAVRWRTDRASAAASAAAELAAQDTRVRAAEVAALERDRLGAELVVLIRGAVDAMRADAGRALESLDVADIARIPAGGATAIADLRRLLGLLQQDVEPVVALRPVAAPRKRWWLDLLLATIVTCGAVVELVLMPTASLHVGVVLPLAFGLVVLRRQPMLAAMALTVPAVVMIVRGAPQELTVAQMVALTMLGWVVGRRRDLGHAALFVVALVVTGFAAGDPGTTAIMLVPALAAGSGFLWGRGLAEEQEQHERAARIRAERTAAEALTRLRERRRLARELHDVTGHAIGIMVLHGGAAEATVERDPDVARRSLTQVIATGDAALTELDLLGRTLGSAPGEDWETDLATRVDSLVERMAGAGLRISTDITAEPLQSEVAHVVYRVVQEGLTNAARHAPGSDVSVEVRRAEDGLVVSVRNGTGVGSAPVAGAGFGLSGVAERVRSVGGMLSAEPGAEGGFHLTACIPDPGRQPSGRP